MWAIGSGFSDDRAGQMQRQVILPDHFDAMIFVETTTAARPTAHTRQRFGITDR